MSSKSSSALASVERLKKSTEYTQVFLARLGSQLADFQKISVFLVGVFWQFDRPPEA
jgi:hypothetical protein